MHDVPYLFTNNIVNVILFKILSWATDYNIHLLDILSLDIL